MASSPARAVRDRVPALLLWERAVLGSVAHFMATLGERPVSPTPQSDHPSRNSRSSFGFVMARTSRLTSGTVGGISSG